MAISLPQAGNGRFATVFSEPPVPGFGRLLTNLLLRTCRSRDYRYPASIDPKPPNANGSFRLKMRLLDELALFALHYKQVQWFRLCYTKDCENRMSLAAMVCFMIEQMGKNFPASLPLGGSV